MGDNETVCGRKTTPTVSERQQERETTRVRERGSEKEHEGRSGRDSEWETE